MNLQQCGPFAVKHTGIICMLMALTLVSTGNSALAKKQTPKQMSERLVRLHLFSDPKEIHELAEDYEKYYGSSRDTWVMGSVVRAMKLSAEVYERSNRDDKALKIYERIVENYSKTKRITPYYIPHAQLRIANIQYQKKNYMASGEACIALLKRLKEQKIKEMIALRSGIEACRLIKKLNQQEGLDLDATPYIDMFELALQAKQTGHEHENMLMHLILAENYEKRGNVKKSLSYYQHVIDYYAERSLSKDPPELLEAKAGIARLKN